MNKETNSCGVVIGRFQTDYLTSAHHALLSKARDENVVIMFRA